MQSGADFNPICASIWFILKSIIYKIIWVWPSLHVYNLMNSIKEVTYELNMNTLRGGGFLSLQELYLFKVLFCF